MKNLLPFLLMIGTLCACSRQPFDKERETPRGFRAVSARTLQDTTGQYQQSREFRTYWKAKEDSIKQAYRPSGK